MYAYTPPIQDGLFIMRVDMLWMCNVKRTVCLSQSGIMPFRNSLWAKRGAACIVGALVLLYGGLGGQPVQAKESAYQFSLSGKVVHVADGDTFTLRVSDRTRRVRMASIDAPETGKGRDQPGQPFGQASRRALADMIAGKTITVHCYEQDRYERAICDVPLSQTDTANQRMVAQGMAWANTEKRGQFLRDPRLPAVQETARAQSVGLWSEPDPVAPWQWRYQCWRQKQCAGQGD